MKDTLIKAMYFFIAKKMNFALMFFMSNHCGNECRSVLSFLELCGNVFNII